ncbi:MAG: zinc transporter, family [Chloroflexota bacterium]|nr:zinc transporter, family [Chloroflexota bacterium]
MLQAAFWGFVAGAALLLGAGAALVLPTSQRVIGLIMAFGGGVLISALAFELVDEGLKSGATVSVAAGLAAGSLTFFAGDWLLDHRGGEHRKRSGGEQVDGSGGAIVLGALLDGIPESIAIGVSLVAGGEVGIAIVAAVFLSNVPEGLSGATGLRKAGYSARFVLALWTGVMLLSAAAAAFGFVVLGGATPEVVGFVQAFAAGAILTMLADTMMPEAFAHGGSVVGLVTVLGFIASALLSHA